MLICTEDGMDLPLISASAALMALIPVPPVPLKTMDAMLPVPCTGVVRMRAIRIIPGVLEFTAIMAPETRLPWVTAGPDNPLES